MKIPVYHLDAFTDKLFSGNPAAVCVLPKWLPETDLFAISRENNLPATTFLVRDGNQFHVRWFAPEIEIPLCGHGSLAAAFVIFNMLEPAWKKVILSSPREKLQLTRQGDLFTLNFPAKIPQKFPASGSGIVIKGLVIPPVEIYQYQNERCLAVYATEEDVRHLHPDMHLLQQSDHRGITVTAPGENVDFVSRTFYPHKIFPEDPVTGAAHSLLTPYWSQRLNKKELHALQISERGGELFCVYEGERVLISGKVVLYMQGTILF